MTNTAATIKAALSIGANEMDYAEVGRHLYGSCVVGCTGCYHEACDQVYDGARVVFIKDNDETETVDIDGEIRLSEFRAVLWDLVGDHDGQLEMDEPWRRCHTRRVKA